MYPMYPVHVHWYTLMYIYSHMHTTCTEVHVHVHEHVQVPDGERCCGAGVEEVLPVLEGCGGLRRGGVQG